VPGTSARLLNGAALLLALATLAGLVAFRPGGGAGRPDLAEAGVTSAFYDAHVLGARTGPCRQAGGVPGEAASCQLVEAQLLEGPDAGRTVRLDFLPSSTNPDLDEGDKVVLSYSPDAPAGHEYQFADRQRKPVLFWLAAAFAGAVVLLGRARGVAALVGLAATLVVLLAFTLPAIIDGRSPVGVAVASAAAIAFIALYLAHGFRPMTTVALLGTLASLGLTAVLAVVFTELARFSGFASEEATFLSFAAGSIDLRGLLLGGVVIGALGAIDDITVTQAAAVAEVRRADPAASARDLYRAGLRVGRDHVASTVNTLVLAYAGASMPLLVLFVLSDQSFTSVANSEVVATEIVRTLVGSIGLVASVPVTTWLAARAVGSPHPDPAAPGLLEDGARTGGGEPQPGGGRRPPLPAAGPHDAHRDGFGEEHLEGQPGGGLGEVEDVTGAAAGALRGGAAGSRLQAGDQLAPEEHRVEEGEGVVEHDPGGDEHHPPPRQVVDRAPEDDGDGKPDDEADGPRDPLAGGEQQRPARRPGDRQRPGQGERPGEERTGGP
jgi:uncharacterized membrane protein